MSKHAKCARHVVVMLIGLVLMRPALAWAHARLTRSEPASGARLTKSPTTLRLWFSEAPEIAMTHIALADSMGNAIPMATVEHGDSKLGLQAKIISTLSPGRYVVSWKTAAADGHPSEGKFAFVVLPSTAVAASEPVSSPGADTAMGRPRAATPNAASKETERDAAEATALTPLYVAVRALTFVSLLIVIGCVVFRVGVIARALGIDGSLLEAMTGRAARLGMYSALVTLAACIARLYVQSRMMNGDRAADAFRLRTMVTDTQWGSAWAIQCAAALGAALAFWFASRRHAGSWALAGVAAVVLAFSPGLGGHAVASSRLTSLAVTVDGLHVVGAAGWLGSLACLILIGVPVALMQAGERRWQTVSSLVNAFSPAALSFAGLAVLTGLISAWLRLGSLSPLRTSTYGRVLLLKLALLIGVAGTGAYNWLRVRPALGTEAATLRLRRSARVELTIGVLVLIVTAILVAVPTPLDAS